MWQILEKNELNKKRKKQKTPTLVSRVRLRTKKITGKPKHKAPSR